MLIIQKQPQQSTWHITKHLLCTTGGTPYLRKTVAILKNNNKTTVLKSQQKWEEVDTTIMLTPGVSTVEWVAKSHLGVSGHSQKPEPPPSLDGNQG